MKTFLLKVRFVLGVFYCLLQTTITYGQDTTMVEHRENGQPKSFSYSKPITSDIYKDGKAFLKEQLKTPPGTEFYMYKKERDAYGNVHEKYQQTYKKIKIEGKEFIIHKDKSGSITTINGDYDSISSVNITSIIPFEQAMTKFKLSRGINKYQLFQLPAESADGKAILKQSDYEQVIFKNTEGRYELAYKINVTSNDRSSNGMTYISAISGKLLFCQPDVKETNAPGTAQTAFSGTRTIIGDLSNGSYRLRETARNGTVSISTLNFNRNPAAFVSDYSTNIPLATDFIDNNNNWTATEYANANYDQAALDAHWGAESTIDYFFTRFARNSYDGIGGPVTNYVHVKTRQSSSPNTPINMENAYWSDQYKSMFYGDGTNGNAPLTCLDICAHEIGHGVCFGSVANGLGLRYSGESGALNESLSDMWGASVENWATTGKSTWLLGEDHNGIGLRSMSNPGSGLTPQPNTYGGPLWQNLSGCSPTNGNDNCYVHFNSGVGNFWFYLLSIGGSGTNGIGNSYNVSGIGIANASKIIYQLEKFHLTYESNYSDARTLSITSAKEIFGAGSCQEIAVTNAWYAVGVGTAYNTADLMASWAPSVCTNQSFTLNGPAVTSWAVSPTNIATLSVNGNTASLSRVDDGSVLLTASYAGCGLSASSVSKTINVGVNNSQGQVTGFANAYANSFYYYDFTLLGIPYSNLTWTVPSGWSINNVSASRVNLTTGTHSGSVVANFNACGAARYRYMNVTVDNSGIPPIIAPNPPAMTKLNISIYPNPSANLINIQMPLGNKISKIQVKDSRSALIEVFNTKGDLKSSQKASYTQPYQVDISKLSPGNYFIKITIGQNVGTGSFIKM